MSSSQAFLAYVFDSEESVERRKIRIERTSAHLAGLYRDGELVEVSVGDGGSGFVGWNQNKHGVDWQPFSVKADTGVAWLHVPSFAGGPDSGVTEFDLARDIFSGVVDPTSVGSPYAVARWQDGLLEIANDVFGLVRLFHYRFPNGDVWTTRPGAAHVFMGAVPYKNEGAWSSMATVGWAVGGHTQLGDGEQLRGASLVRGGFSASGRFLKQENLFRDWILEARASALPSAADIAQDIGHSLDTSLRWPSKAVADLSGGKDSRVVAAVAIKNGAVDTVRTIRTDNGEVATAEGLMKEFSGRIVHDIQEKKIPSRPDEHFMDRLCSQQRAWEGRYLAASAFNRARFKGFGRTRSARLNGLGGEVMAGGNHLGAAKDRLIGASPDKAVDRAVGMTRSFGLGISDVARERSADESAASIRKIAEFGTFDAAQILDLFYHIDKMPNWSVTFADSNNVTPLFAPKVLTYAVHRLGRPLPPGDSHRHLLREIIPSWSDTPFYSPGPKGRAFPYVWQGHDWGSIRSFIEHRLGVSDNFDPQAVRLVITEIEAGNGGKQEEVFVFRYLWEASFEAYVDEVAAEARETLRAVSCMPA